MTAPKTSTAPDASTAPRTPNAPTASTASNMPDAPDTPDVGKTPVTPDTADACMARISFGALASLCSKVTRCCMPDASGSCPGDIALSPQRRAAWNVQGGRGAVQLVWGTMLGFVLLLIWGALAQVDQVVRGVGQVVPSQRVQQLQNLEGGILQELLVKEGQIVEADAIVARIDNEMAGSEYRDAQTRSLDIMASIAHTRALLEGGEPQYPLEVLEHPDIVQRHNDILAATRAQNQAEQDMLASQVESRQREAREQEEQQRQLNTSLELAVRQRDLAKAALAAKAYSQLDYLNLEQRLQNLNAELAKLEHSIPRLQAAAQEAEHRCAFRKTELATQYRTSLNEYSQSLRSLREFLAAGGDKVKRTEMRSPVRGVVKRIYVTTVGGVLAPGATLMEIVPLDDTLIVEARFSPADIAFLRPEQKAVVRLSAYDFAVYGGLNAQVTHISADTIEGRQGDFYFLVRVRTARNYIEDNGRHLPIMAGMLAEVDIITGRKSILDYVLKPLLKVKQRALTEQ